MTILTKYESINRVEWSSLCQTASTATWFQSPEAYIFYAEQPELFTPFIFAVSDNGLKGVCVGYITRESKPLKQFFTRRAIIIGGPLLADDATNEQASILMSAVRNHIAGKAIYIETRNFNNYANWHNTFCQVGFAYKNHLNFHIDTPNLETVNTNLSENRRRDIRAAIKHGATTIESPSLQQVSDFYQILSHLYRTKVKTPLFPISFFRHLYNQPNARFLLVEFQGQIVGGTVCVILENRCVYEWFVAGKDVEFKSVFPSSLATYAGLKFAAEHNCPRFDMMGAGKPDEAYGVRTFKARFGGQEVEYGRFLFICKPLLYRLGVLGVKLLKRR